jgi:hypothetical protein
MKEVAPIAGGNSAFSAARLKRAVIDREPHPDRKMEHAERD